MSTAAFPSESEAPTSSLGAPIPRVVAIIVTHNGAEWVLGAIRTLRAQRYPNLKIVAVDNASTDGTAEILDGRLGGANVVTADRDLGFGRGVVAGLRSPVAEDADYILLMHDDMALMPDSVQWLVRAMESDSSLAIVGPKLRSWDEEPLLQQVGMSADVFGRAEPLLDADEMDQGQHDGRADMLYVSTAGMLLRRDVFSSLGGFDARFDQFRDDFDLCWRVWLSGRRVAVVTQAVGYHLAATSNGAQGRRDLVDSRYRVERHTLASLIKNSSAARLAWVLPIGALINVARIIGMLLSRRFGEAAAVVRAYLWNLAQLPATLRRRAVVQKARRQPDSSLRSLFAPGLPRVQRYSDAVMETIAGGSTRALVDADDVGRVGIDPLGDKPIMRFLRDRPLVLLGIPLLLAFLASLTGYLADGPIIGGDIAAWPQAVGDFFRSYMSPWGGEPLGSASFPSPIQPILGLLSLLVGGSAWFAQRVLVFGLVPLAFVATLRAGRLVTARPWPRVIGAGVYVTSPVVLGTLAQGRYGTAVLAALLPSVVALTIRTADPSTAPGVAWRSTALLSVSTVVVLGASPVEGTLVLGIVATAALVAVVRGWIRPLLRLATGALSALVIVSPWLFDLTRDGGPAGGTLANGVQPPALIELPLWRALVGQPQLVSGLDGVLSVLLLAVPAAILLGAVVVGMRARPLITGALVLLVVASGGGAWAAAYYALPLLWAPAVLLPGALALAVLAMIVARWSTETLAASDFGIGQVGTGVAAMGLVVGLVAGMLLLAGGPWQRLQQDPQLVPAFIGADVGQVGPYRVLLLDRAADGSVTWEVTGATGPSMVSFGTIRSASLTGTIDDAVTQLVSGVGNGPGATLGLLNVRFVVVLAPDADLQSALARQRDLEPLPTTAAVSYQVRSWVPRASVIAEPAATRLLATGDPGQADRSGSGALLPVSPGEFRGGAGGAGSGLLVLSEAESTAWRAADSSRVLEHVDLPPVNAFRVTDSVDSRFRVSVAGNVRRRLVVAVQLLLAFGVVSLAVRPPGSREDEIVHDTLPADLVGLADTTTVIPRIDPDMPPPGDLSTGGSA